MEDKFVKVELISSFRQTYVIPYEALQEMNTKVQLTDELALQWAEESVMCEEIKELAQQWIGENVFDKSIINTEQAIKQFRKQNPDYSKEMSDAQIVDWINDWEDPIAKGKKKADE